MSTAPEAITGKVERHHTELPVPKSSHPYGDTHKTHYVASKDLPEHYVSQVDTRTDKDEPNVGQRLKSKRRVCGLPLPWLVGAVILLLLAVIAGVVGGVLGSRKHGSQSTNSSSNSNSTSGNLTASSDNSTSRYPSIAVTQVGGENGSTWLFHLDTENEGLHVRVRNSSGWFYRGVVQGLLAQPRMSNSLSAVSWVDDDKPRVVLYYNADVDPPDIYTAEINCSPDVPTLPNMCAVIRMDSAPLHAPYVGSGSRPTLHQWGTTSATVTQYGTLAGDQIRGNYIADNGDTCDMGLIGQNAIQPGCFTTKAYLNSSIVAVLDSLPDVRISTYYIIPSGSMMIRRWILDHNEDLGPIYFKTQPSNYSYTGNLAISNIGTTPNISTSITHIYRLTHDRNVMDWKLSPGGTEAAVTEYTSTPWMKADHNMDGIAALAWRSSDDKIWHNRVYYPSGGSIVEMAKDGQGWYQGLFPITNVA